MTPLATPPQPVLVRNFRAAKAELEGGSKTSQLGRRVYSFQIEQPAASWLDNAVAEIQELTQLPSDWDGYGSPAVSGRAAIDAASFVLHAAYPEMDAPDIVPAPDGLQVEWHQGGVDVEVVFTPTGSRTFIHDHESGETIERAGSEAVGEITRLAARLSAT